MKYRYKFCSIRINVTKYYITFATKGESNPKPLDTPLVYETDPRQIYAVGHQVYGQGSNYIRIYFC